MGWFGYGKYDGDETSSVQTNMVEEIAKKFEIALFDKKGKSIEVDNLYLAKVDKGFLNESSAKAIAKHLDYALDKIISKPKKSRKTGTVTWDDSTALEYMMVADFFMNHNLDIPEKHHKNFLVAVDFLTGEHASEFDTPGARRRVLNKFIKDLDVYPNVTGENAAQMDLFKDNSNVRKLKY